MAKRKKHLFSGVVGPVIFKILRGEQLVTARPKTGTIKQSEGSIKAQSTFGISSKLSGKIRQSFVSLLKNREDSCVSGRVTGALNIILQQVRNKATNRFSFESNAFDSLTDLDFNSEAPMNKYLLVNPVVNFDRQQLTVELLLSKPTASIRFPDNAKACRLTVAVCCFALADGLRFMHPLRKDLMIEKEESKLDVENFNFTVPAGCLCIVTTSLVFLSGSVASGRALSGLKLNPSSISAAVITAGTFSKTEEFPWIEMDGLRLA
jgi:hypothetical protein